MRHTVSRQRRILRAQPHAEAERRGVLQPAQQHVIVADDGIGLRERHAAGVDELGHLGELHALERLRQRADRVNVRLVEILGAELEHFDQPRFVQRRIGVRRAGEAGDAAGDGRFHFRFERRHVLEAGLAQPRGEIDQSRAHDQPGGIDGAVGGEALGGVADGHDLAGGNVHILVGVDAVAGSISRPFLICIFIFSVMSHE